MSLAIKPDCYWGGVDYAYPSDDRQPSGPIPTSPVRKADRVTVPANGARYGDSRVYMICVSRDYFSTRSDPARNKLFVLAGRNGHLHAHQRENPRQFARVEAHTESTTRRVESSIAFARQLEHLYYLTQVSSGDDPLISLQTSELARRAWNTIWEASEGRMPIPSACTGPDGQMLYAWDRGVHHLELEIIPDRPAEFFYKNRESRELWGEDYLVGEPIPSEASQKFGFFF